MLRVGMKKIMHEKIQQKFMAIGGERLNKECVSKIDQRIIAISGKQHPQILFIPTASRDHAGYVEKFTDYFQFLGAQVDVLYLYTEQPTAEHIQEKIDHADIIYVGGGNTLRMMNLWRKLGVDLLLQQAWNAGKVLCGTSAGSICWFKSGNSDSRKDNNPAADYIKVTALGFIDAMNCPHYDSESDRKASFKKMLKKYSGVGIALDDFAALEIVGDTCKILTSSENAQGYKIYWKDGLFHEQVLDRMNYQSLADLLSK
jgi:dipeptidase E